VTSASPTSTHLEAEISTQPHDWVRAREYAREYAGLLPGRGAQVAVIGCGTSLFMAQAFAELREGSGQGITDAWPASEHRLDRGYDHVLAITRSGTTTEILEVLEKYQGKLPTTVVTATADSPVLGLAESILTPHLDEQSVVQTRFATGTLAMLRAHLGEDLSQAADQAQEVLDAEESVLGRAPQAEQITFVGRGWTNGLANEAALKLRESAQAWTESYPMTEYRHGPLSISAPGRVVWAFGEPVKDFAKDVAVTGAELITSDIDPMADLVRVHRLCLVKARAAGLDPDRPRNLTRSIILDEDS